jgi:hypothetical protein
LTKKGANFSEKTINSIQSWFRSISLESLIYLDRIKLSQWIKNNVYRKGLLPKQPVINIPTHFELQIMQFLAEGGMR